MSPEAGELPDTYAASLVVEYAQRRTLAELGYKFDGSSISSHKAACFSIIASEIRSVTEERMKAMGASRDG